MSIVTDVQKSFPGTLVTLFQLDCSKLDNGPVLLFTSSSNANEAIMYNGESYTPIDIQAEGFEWNGQGAFPNPTLRLSNVTRAATALVNTYDDLIGAEVRRIRTLSQYLDNGATPDPNQIFSIDVFKIEQKTMHNRMMIEWKLSAAIDQEGTKLPFEIMIRDYCTRMYRMPRQDGTFDYSESNCPYAGSTYFNRENVQVTDPRQDVCAKTLTACKKRFGENEALPIKACPGLGRLR